MIRRRRRSPRPPPGLYGVEVLPTLTSSAADAGARDRAELEFWRAIIPPIAPAELAAARARRLSSAGIEHLSSAQQCRSAQSRADRAALDAQAKCGPVEKPDG